MRLSPFPRLYRNLNRSLEVAGILSKYGLADWIHRHDVEFAKGLLKSADGVKLAELSLPVRIRLALSELGPTFIKLGQMLSTRADIVGAEIANELQGLLTDAPADAPEVVRALVGVELGRPVDDVFLEFDDVPLASASIGQVHAARLKTGERVVVKVQHAGIESKIRDDLEILVGLAEMAEGRPELVAFRPRATAFEFQRSILRELDFSREERNLTEFRNLFGDNLFVAFPQPYPEYSTSRVLTMQRFEGVRISDMDSIVALGFDRDDLARRGATIFLTMIFEARFYHADPHPGNILVLPDGKIGVLDCGMVARLDDRMAEDIGELFLAVNQKDVERLMDAVLRLGDAPPNLDRSSLQFDLADFISQYAAVPIDKLDLGAALNDVVGLCRRYHILLPTNVAMLIRVLVMLEGTAKMLNPQMSIVEFMKPYHSKLAWQRFSPMRQLRRWTRIAQEWESLSEVMPRHIVDILQQVQAGRFDVHLEHRGLEPSVNRLVFGLITSAMFVGSSLLLAHQVPPRIGDVSVLGGAGYAISVVFGMRLIWAIGNSGALDRRKNS